MANGPYLTAERQESVLVLTLNRPPVNAVTVEVLEEILGTYDEIFSNQEIGCVVFASGVRVFCGGVDLGEKLDTRASRIRAALWRSVKDSIRQCPVPTIASVNGACVGIGMGVINVMDIRLASESASFGLPEVNNGRAGGASQLRRFVSEGAVRKLMYTGSRMSAAEALRVHLVEEVIPDDQLATRTLELATEIASKDHRVQRLIKRSLDESEPLGPEAGYAAEQLYTRIMMSQDLTNYR
jgi:enoyl-CoA hydratase